MERHNRFHPEAKTPRKAYVTQQLEGRHGPAIAAIDYIRAYPEQAEWLPFFAPSSGQVQSDTD